VKELGPTPRLAPVAALLLLLVAARPAHAEAGRYAIVVGDNQGDRSEMVLRYSESDARRVAEVLRSVGGFFPENITTLTNVAADDVRRALIGLNARLRQNSGHSVLFVFYSGHADADALHLAGTRLNLTELRDLAAGSPAEARVLVVDSCRSGVLTRVKGGRPARTFDIQVDVPFPAQGLAILTSSAAGEDSQESDQLGASIFTHHLLSGLLGAADRDGDGRISVDEAFTYAAERTLASTALTLPGPQHPTYRLEMGGRMDLLLTEPGAKRADLGSLVFAQAGTYLIQRDGPSGNIVAELTSGRGGGRVVAEGGRYLVTQRGPDHLQQGTFTVSQGRATVVAENDLRRIDYARVVRKGSGQRPWVLGAFALAGGRSDLLDLGTALRGDLGARLDLHPLSVELRVALGRSDQTNERLGIRSYETALSLGALHVFDFASWSVGLGLEAGASWFTQHFDDPLSHQRDTLAGFVGPLLQLEYPVARRFYLRAEGAFLTYLLQQERQGGVSTLGCVRLAAGSGVYF
jgi:hypothetical protein